MYVFNRITVNPQLPKRIGRITEIANNLWWSWNTEFLRLFKIIDIDFINKIKYGWKDHKETYLFENGKTITLTNWSQTFIALECARGGSTLAIIGTPCIAQNQLTTSPSFNPFKIFGPNMRDLLDYAGECGFNRKQLEKLHLKRMKTLYRSIGKYKIDKKPEIKLISKLTEKTEHYC